MLYETICSMIANWSLTFQRLYYRISFQESRLKNWNKITCRAWTKYLITNIWPESIFECDSQYQSFHSRTHFCPFIRCCLREKAFSLNVTLYSFSTRCRRPPNLQYASLWRSSWSNSSSPLLDIFSHHHPSFLHSLTFLSVRGKQLQFM